MAREVSTGTRELRTRVRQFVANQSKHGRRLDTIFERIRDHQWNAVLFGGVLRDLMLGVRPRRPRDIDIVVEGVSAEELQDVFQDLVFRRNRFGGLQLARRGISVDVWPLTATWAFRHSGDPDSSFTKLPTTTFLNIEAVAVELTSAHCQPRRVYSFGFFESLERRVLELNCAANPFPALCVVRTLVMARKLGFGIGPRLADYIRVHRRELSAEDLIIAQTRHYGRLFLGEQSLDRCLRTFDEPARDGIVTLPRLEPLQLELAELDIPLRKQTEPETLERRDGEAVDEQ